MIGMNNLGLNGRLGNQMFLVAFHFVGTHTEP